MKVSATLKGRPDAWGRLTVTIRINDGFTRRFQATPYKVHPKDFKNGHVLASHPDYRNLNVKILELLMQVEKKGFDIKEEKLTFDRYADFLIRKWKDQKHPDTLRHYKSSLKKFSDFKPGIALAEVDHEVLQEFRTYIAEFNKPNTVWTTFRFMRLVIYKALKEGKIPQNPFNLFEMPKYKDPPRLFLTDEQIESIEELDHPDLNFAKTWFLIGVHSGLRFADMRKFDRKRNIKNNRLIVYTSKTGEPVGMPLNKDLKRLLESVDYKPLGYTNEHYNRLLKQIASLADIDENLTAHVSRHTAAVRWANAGISQEVVSKLLGHNSLKTTGIYFRITSQRVDDELKKLG